MWLGNDWGLWLRGKKKTAAHNKAKVVSIMWG